MVLWVILFLLVVGISFLLAFRSMRDYHEIPQSLQAEYGLFLIRQVENFNANILDSIRGQIHAEDLIISLERLFKGKQAALAIFGPKKILASLSEQLNLLELEDYAANLNSQDVFTWEVGVKVPNNVTPEEVSNIFNNLPQLHEDDQFFWQVILACRGKEKGSFQTQIRAAFFTKNLQRKQAFVPLLQNLSSSKLVKIPKPFSAEQMASFYRLRSLSKDSKGPVLTSHGVTSLLKI